MPVCSAVREWWRITLVLSLGKRNHNANADRIMATAHGVPDQEMCGCWPRLDNTGKGSNLRLPTFPPNQTLLSLIRSIVGQINQRLRWDKVCRWKGIVCLVINPEVLQVKGDESVYRFSKTCLHDLIQRETSLDGPMKRLG